MPRVCMQGYWFWESWREPDICQRLPTPGKLVVQCCQPGRLKRCKTRVARRALRDPKLTWSGSRWPKSSQSQLARGLHKYLYPGVYVPVHQRISCEILSANQGHTGHWYPSEMYAQIPCKEFCMHLENMFLKSVSRQSWHRFSTRQKMCVHLSLSACKLSIVSHCSGSLVYIHNPRVLRGCSDSAYKQTQGI